MDNVDQVVSLMLEYRQKKADKEERQAKSIPCGVCGRSLIDDHSKAAGIGPVCIAKMVE